MLSSVDRTPVIERDSLFVYDYQEAWPILADSEPVPYRRYDTVFPSWDNSPRTGNGPIIMHNSTPEAYEQWLRQAISKVQGQPADHRIVFINAWNEWAEGCHLEPDRRHGLGYLEATKRALVSPRKTTHMSKGQR